VVAIAPAASKSVSVDVTNMALINYKKSSKRMLTSYVGWFSAAEASVLSSASGHFQIWYGTVFTSLQFRFLVSHQRRPTRSGMKEPW
jgi:hypothetical protein